MNQLFAETAKRLSLIVPSNPDHEVIYNFLFGALYALAQAEHLGYPNQSSEQGKSASRTAEVKKLATEMASNEVLPDAEDGEWLAGFYFNDALFRLGICLEHLLRHHTGLKGRDDHFPALIKDAPEIEQRVTDWKKIKDEVDAMRHRSWDYQEGPATAYAQALTRMRDVVEAVEWAFDNPRKPTA